MWGQLSTTCSNATEVTQWGAPCCSRTQAATDNGVRDGRFNRLAITPTVHRAVPHELHVLHVVKAGYKWQKMQQQLWSGQASLGMPDQLTAGAATRVITMNISSVYNNRCRYRRRPAMTDGQLTADIRRRLFGVYLSQAVGDI